MCGLVKKVRVHVDASERAAALPSAKQATKARVCP